MTIAFRCPKCQSIFQADDSQAGQIQACTSCNAQLRVPTAPASPSPQPLPLPSSAWDGLDGSGTPGGATSSSDQPAADESWHSPYAPPQAELQPVMPTRQVGYFFRAANGMVGVLTVLFVLNAMMDLLFVFLEAALLTLDVSALARIIHQPTRRRRNNGCANGLRLSYPKHRAGT